MRATNRPISRTCPAAVKKAVSEGKSYARRQKEVSWPKYRLGDTSVPAHEYRALLRFLEPRDLTKYFEQDPRSDLNASRRVLLYRRMEQHPTEPSLAA